MHSFPRRIVPAGLVLGLATTFMVLTALPVLAGPTPAEKCEAAKNKTAGSYYACREKAEAAAITKAISPDYSKCTARFDDKWDSAETTGAGMCPDSVLTASINAYIAAQAAEAASVIAGAGIPDCAGDLATCQSDSVASVRPPLRTSQLTCYNSSGTAITCAASGQDGEVQKGAARSFTDNGDGTITDNTTELMWEKLSDDGTIHDKDNLYTWDEAFASKVEGLNSASFAGHTDWRVPNLNELETLRNLGAANPATYSAFNTACSALCTLLTCSCTQLEHYWSSTTYQDYPSYAWYVYFANGTLSAADKTDSSFVRAVRSGS